MAKGGGSARLQCLGADLLEGRLLLSHAPGIAASHALAATPAHVAPTPAAPRPEAEPAHSAANEAETRVAEESDASFAASTAPKDGPTIPLLAAEKPTDDFDDSSDSARGLPNPARYLRVTYRDEPVAWRLMVEGWGGNGPISKHWVAESPEIPESAAQLVEVARPGGVPGQSTAAESPEVMPSPERSDLLADFLPSDREALDRAIDALLDGFGRLGGDFSKGVEATTPIPSPVVLGFGLAVLEVFRRRLRRRSRQDAEGERDADGESGDGFLAFRG